MSWLDNLRFTAQRLSGHRSKCGHRDQIRQVAPESTTVCPRCVARGDTWKALRVCASCGRVGCCDSSKNGHARSHAETSGHLIVRSLEPGEDWLWCFADRRLIEDPQPKR